jgi:hypothetical protein
MSPAALAATVTGTLLTLAPIPAQAIRNATRTITPDAPFEQAPEVAADLRQITTATRGLAIWQQVGPQYLADLLDRIDQAENRLIAAHGYPVPNDEQRYRARQARARAVEAVHAAADRAHPPVHCPNCRAWEDCPAADRALRDAIHEDWANRWDAPVTSVAAGPHYPIPTTTGDP